jgi:hypothetical protein
MAGKAEEGRGVEPGVEDVGKRLGGAKPGRTIDTAAEIAEVVTEPASRPAPEARRDMTEMSGSQRAFAEAVMLGQRRNTMLAAGAAGGAMVALVLAGLVYFQSVDDLRMAADVQAEAAKLLVEEVKQIDGIADLVTEQQSIMKTDLLATLELVKDEIRRAAMAGPEPAPEAEPMDAQIATAIREGVKADLDVMRDEILTALAEAELALLNGTGDPEMTELLAGVKALVAATEPPVPVEAAARSTATPAKPRPKPQPANAAPAEPNPFTYP